MSNDTENKLMGAQLNALIKKLQSGTPLTPQQLEFAQQQIAKKQQSEGQSSPQVVDDLCSTASELATQLGVSRQVISWHKTRNAAPKALSISAWREYLIANGKLPVYSKVEATGSQPGRKGFAIEVADQAMAVLFDRLSDRLPHIVRVALKREGITATEHQTDEFIFIVWASLASVAQGEATRQGCIGPFDPVGEGDKVESPDEIKKLAGKLLKKDGSDPA